MTASEHWEGEAERWAAWARTPGHDAYWCYRDAFFQLVPPPGRATLEVGCGEGRVSRDLAARGHAVTGVDVSPALLELAQQEDRASTYVLGDAVVLPFPDGSFDLVVAYNSLMDVDDMRAAVLEITRVLEPGGCLGVCVTHPLMDFLNVGAYFGRNPYEGTFERDGLTITFRGWCYPIEDYARALEEAGFLIEAIREPMPSPDAPPHLDEHKRIPMFLMLRARKGGVAAAL